MRSSAPRRRLAIAALVGTLAAAACGRAEAGRQRLDVYAASSLTEAFRDMEAGFESAHPDVDVALTFAGSQVLRLQIEQGAAADVFASANPEHLDALFDAGLVGDGRVFAHNELVIAVPRDNPPGITTFADLPRAKRLVIGTENVPVGQYAREAFRRTRGVLGPSFEAGVLASVVSEETNVRLTRAKVELGEADAAVVYATDVAGSDRIRTVPIPPEFNVRADYVMGVVSGRASGGLADRWIDYVMSDVGRQVLARRGFGLP